MWRAAQYIFLGTLLILWPVTIISQNNTRTFSFEELYAFCDTIQQEDLFITLRIKWLTDTVEIRKLKQPVRWYLDNGNTKEQHRSYLQTPSDTLELITFMETAAQNCYSYALEQYFKHLHLSSQGLFDRSTHLPTETFKTILESTFTKQHTRLIKSSRLNNSFPDASIIVFINNHGWMTHASFYHAKHFHSKNVATIPVICKRVKELYQEYPDTRTIEAYSIDSIRIWEYLEKK
ncbi:hypothetical protein DMA11_14330 [Marinilabiliaceae bacterium JC017]|nr:hypothetical protein DMA11_14330 [Marinilabiliaceae bacterium JC017]